MICDLMNNDNKNNCEEKVKDTVHRIDTNVGNKYVRCDDEVKINDINDNPKSGYIRLVSYGIWTRSMQYAKQATEVAQIPYTYR